MDSVISTNTGLLQVAEQELSRRKALDPLEYIDPAHNSQIEAHKDNSNVLIVLGANRAGKSNFAMKEALEAVLGRDKWKKHRWKEHGFGPVVWYIMPSLPQAGRAIMPKFWKYVPKGAIIDYNEHQGVVRRARFRTQGGVEGEIHFLSAEMRQLRLQGASVDLVIMDETPDEEIYKEAAARVVDRKGRIILVFSPINIKSFWVRDKLIVPAQIGERKDITVLSMPVADEDGKVVVPHLTQEQIDQMFRMYPDPADREARIYGRFTTRQGLVFGQFDPMIHMIPRFKLPNTWSRFWSVDPQYHRFGALLFSADEHGNYYIAQEYFSQKETLAERAIRMWLLTQEEFDGPIERSVPVYVDSANPQDIAELNYHFRRLGAKLGAIPLPMQKRVDKMLLRVQSLLESDNEREYTALAGMKGIFGAPRLLVFDDINSIWWLDERRMVSSRLLWELTHYAWARDGKPDKQSAEGADLCDCLIYGCSIPSRGFMEKDPLAWTRGLSDEDIIIRMAERHMDLAERLRRHGMEPL